MVWVNYWTPASLKLKHDDNDDDDKQQQLQKKKKTKQWSVE